MATSFVKVNYNDPNYKNWLKVGRALQLTAKAMTPFCTDVIKSFHNSLKISIGSNVCSSGCTSRDIKKKSITCGSNVCNRWLSGIVPELATSQFSWHNTTVDQWPVAPWQIGKIFMGAGQDETNTNPLKTDPAGILQLTINCKQFDQHFTNKDKVKKVRDVRNATMHSPDFKFATADMKTHLQCMIDLLQEPALQAYTTAKTAVVEIKQIEAVGIGVSDEAFLQNERDVWKDLVADQTTNRKEIEKIIDSNEDLKKRLGDIATQLKKDIDYVKDELQKTQKTQVRVEAVQQQHDHNISKQQASQQQLQEQQNKQAEDISYQQSSQQQLQEQQNKQADDISYQQSSQQLLQEQQNKQAEDISQQQASQHLLQEQQNKQAENISQQQASQQQLQEQQNKQAENISQQQASQQQLQEQQNKQAEDISYQQSSQQLLQEQQNRQAENISQQKASQQQLQEQQTKLQEHQKKQDENISHLLNEAAQKSHQKVRDELKKWRSDLKDAQTRMLERYVIMKNDEENTTFQKLTDMFIDLRMHNSSDNYQRLEKRIHHDNLQLQREIDACRKISVRDLFQAEPGMMTPVRSLVIGKAGIGKSMLSLHIADQWLQSKLLPNDIQYLFLFRLRDLSSIKTCSLEDLFFKYQSGGMPSQKAIAEFFQRIVAEPHKTLIIFDGLDEIGMLPLENGAFAYNTLVETPRLIASILNGCTIPSIRLLVTSRPGSIIKYDAYDKKAEIYGFTREKMSDYIVKFSGENLDLKKSLEDYIDQNVNICSFCYVPVHMNMICRIVKERMQHENNPKLPETLTELFVGSVRNFLLSRHPKFKEPNLDKTVDVIAELKDSLHNHASLARYGMEQVPIKVTFDIEEMRHFHLEHDAMQCGLVSESRESSIVMFTPAVTPVYFFQHLTVEEFLAAISLITNINQMQQLMNRASDRQLDLVVIFLAGLLGNINTHPFLCSLHGGQWNSHESVQSLEQLMKLVVTREQTNEARTTENKSAVHKASILLLLTIIHESRQPDLWHHVSDYVLTEDTILNLRDQHISPTELHALQYILPHTTGITTLDLGKCGITGKEAEHMMASLGNYLPQLTLLRLFDNADLHGPAWMTAFSANVVKLTRLQELGMGGCQLTDEDITILVTALPALTCLRMLWLQWNRIRDDGAVKVTEVAVKLPQLQGIGLGYNCLTNAGVDRVRRAAAVKSRMRLMILDLQRLPVEKRKDENECWMLELNMSLSRLYERPVQWRDRAWCADISEIQGWLDKAQDVQSKRNSEAQSDDDDVLFYQRPVQDVTQELVHSDPVVRWQWLLDQVESAMHRCVIEFHSLQEQQAITQYRLQEARSKKDNQQ